MLQLHIAKKGNIHRNLKYCDLKTSKHPWEMWKNKTNILYILYILQKTNLEKKSQQH